MSAKKSSLARRVLGLALTSWLTAVLTAAAWAQTAAQIYGFAGYNFAYGGLILDAAGNLYGTTYLGGTGFCNLGCGTVFMLSPANGGWTETVLYNFAGGSDGEFPAAGLVFDAAGNLYGTTDQGGAASCSCGTVFRLSPASGGGWTETILHSFTYQADGAYPQGPLAVDASGNLYGNAFRGGTVAGSCAGEGCGVVFRLSLSSNGTWKETVLHSFSGGSDGGFPVGAVNLVGSTLYGATTQGGILSGCANTGCGVVFRLSHGATGWKETVLHNFTGGADGSNPTSGVTRDSARNLFGATTHGGNTKRCPGLGCGVAFKLSHASGWKETVLHTFTKSNDGAFPTGPVSVDANGNVFGETIDPSWCTTFINTCGVVFKLSPASGGWQVSALYQIPNDWAPSGGLVIDTGGNIFGMGDGSSQTGASGVFTITP
jgi:uncharacterized repeat protein (TIGR03803 family)